MPRVRSLRSLAISANAPGRAISPGPPSPTFSETTNASAINLGVNGPQKIITRANLKASMQAYEDLLNKTAGYRTALMAMSKATAAFADAMEACSNLKGVSYESGARLQASSGLHHLMGNQWHVLGDSLDKKFEKPLRQHLENYRSVVMERSVSYERILYEKSNIIRQTEMQSMNKKQRNLQTFREALAVMQRQVDELDNLKVQHYQEIMEHEEEVWDVVQGKVCLVVRSTLDVFDRFTAKASDPVIEPMLQSVPDPFDSYGPPKGEDQIFSILAPLSIMSNTPSLAATPSTGTPEVEHSDLPGNHSTSSWIDNPHGLFPGASSMDWANVPSSSPPRATSPPSSSTSPRSASPPSVTRRHPLPIPSSNHSTIRKSDSKPRSSLSSIDESYVRADDPISAFSPESPSSTAEMTDVNSHGQSRWDHFLSLGRSSSTGGESGNTISRHPNFRSLPHTTPDSTPEGDRGPGPDTTPSLRVAM